MSEELIPLTIYCYECDNECCPAEAVFPRPQDSEGCTRLVPQEIADEYYYRTIEQYPFILENNRLSLEDKVIAANDLLDWLHKNIYSASLGSIVGHRIIKL